MTNLYKYYVSCYIKKQGPLYTFDFQYRNHMFKLHEIYINNLKPDRKSMNKTIVNDYINNLHPAQLMFSLNYHLRK